MKKYTLLIITFIPLLTIVPRIFAQTASVVNATVETTPVTHSKDAADDMAIWIHPADSSKSVIIGTDKGGALEVYRVSDGVRIQQIAISGGTNNVDLRYNFPLGTEKIDLVVASTGQAFRAYRVNQSNGLLTDITGTVTGAGGGGMSLYHSVKTDDFYYFSNDNCVLKQSRLSGTTGKVNATVVRNFTFGNCSGADAKTEGITADDTYGNLYVSEELVAIWKYAAEPNGGSTKTAVDTVQSGHFVPDVEGLAIYYKRDGSGYLLASSQGQTKVGGNSNSYVLYQRTGNNAYIGNFRIGDGVVDGVSNTDGIDVSNVNLGPKFPQGAFVVQDGDNPGGNQNFKIVPWEQIAGKFSLSSDTSYNPRNGGDITITPTIVTATPPQGTPTEPCPSIPQNTGTVTMSLTIPGNATYKLLSRIMVPNNLLHTYWIQIDNACAQEFGKSNMTPNNWTWIDTRLSPPSGPATIFLTEGQHTIKLIGSSTEIKIDAIKLTTDLTCLPTNLKGTCNEVTPTLVPTATIAPTATLTPTPTGITSTPTKAPTTIPTKTPVPTKSVTPTISSGRVVLKPLADTFVLRGDKRNFGGRETLEVDGDPVKIVYMKFNLSPVLGKKITKAELRLRIVNTSQGEAQLRRVRSTTWNEANMIYSNRPELGSVVGSFTSPQENTWREIDVTKAFAESFGQQISLGVSSQAGNGADFYSSENERYSPELVIHYN